MARRGGKATAKKRTAKQREEAARKAARNQAGQAESEEEIVSLAQLNPNSNSKRYRDASRLCKEPGCAIPLGYRNTSGYCSRHLYPQGRPSVSKKRCQECAKQLTVRNVSGYCALHRYPQNRPSVAKQACKKCGTRLRFTNKSGYCQDHYYLSPQSEDVRKVWKRDRALSTKIVKAKNLLAEQGILARSSGSQLD